MEIDNAAIENKSLRVTRKELFYAAAMLHLKQLVNIVYDFPADTTLFDQELREAKSSLRKKQLLKESAREGVTLDFALTICAVFCAMPEKCEVVSQDNYHAAIYEISSLCMLFEELNDDEFKALWFLDRYSLDKYIETKINNNAKTDLKGESGL
ncbi:MAG: hypothetical protein IJ576_03650 [Synergistaceae bacterium]|nr:hypothetical protein [Synergistaceae bacterium]MBR1603406.1 hypothetical protein [Synergistaceae bacterium]